MSQEARNLDQQWDKLAKSRKHWDHSRHRGGVGKLQFMINEVPDKANAVKKLSKQLAGPSELDMQDLIHGTHKDTATSQRCGNNFKIH